MNQLERSESRHHHNTNCTELLSLAEQELAAFFAAVTDLFGSAQAELSAEDWLDELQATDTLPASIREWRQITINALARLAGRCGNAIAMPATELQPAY